MSNQLTAIGINQPPFSGTDYPFVAPSDDLKFIFVDFYLSYNGPFYANGRMKLAWLAGFGDVPASQVANRPAPVNARDLVLEDLDGNVLINTTDASAFSSFEWSDDYDIVQWQHSTYFMRCVVRKISKLPTGVPVQFEPQNGLLDPHTIYQVPQHVTRFRVNGQNLPNSVITLESGYNVAIDVPTDNNLPLLGTTTTVNKATRVRLDAVPGAGLGVFPRCTDVTPTVKSINGVQGNSFQNFNIDAEGCIRIQRPVGLLYSNPRTFTYQATGLTSEGAGSAIALGNGCKPCCDCSYFTRTYKGLTRQWNLYKSAAESAELLRDDYREIVNRWMAQKQCRESDTIRVVLSPDGSSKVTWGIVHCNASKCCLVNVQVRITWIYKVDGVLQVPVVPSYDCQKTVATSPTFGEGSIRIFSGRGPETQGIVNVLSWASSDAQSNTSLTGRHCFPEAQSIGDSVVQVQAHIVMSWDTALPDQDAGPCSYPVLTSNDYPTEVKSMWSLTGESLPVNGRFQKLSDVVTVDIEDPFCERCECETTVPTKPVNPAKFPLICHWLDGKDVRTMDISGSSVLEWRSKRGDMMTLKPPPLKNPPTYNATNGLVLFNGTNQALYNPFYELGLHGGFIAVVSQASATSQVLFSSSISGVPAENYTLMSDRSRIGNAETTTTSGFDNLNLFMATYTPGTIGVVSKIFRNGTETSSVTVTRAEPKEGVFVGINSDLATGLLNGAVGEILIGCDIPSTSDRQIVEGYLAWRWGLQGQLPNGHPYKDNQPLV